MCVCVCVCVSEQDSALNNLQRLICHKTQPTNEPTLVQSAGAVEYTDCISAQR